MGIDVYTTTLASHLRHVNSATADALTSGSRYPLTREGVQVAARKAQGQANLTPSQAGSRASQLYGLLGLTSAGSPSAPIGPILQMEPDQLDARQWHVLQAAARRREVVNFDDALKGLDDDDGIFDQGFFDSEWDSFPGIDFARAVERANSLVVPAGDVAGFVAGSLAIVTMAAGEAFLLALADRLNLPRATFDDNYDPDMSDAANAALYNPRLLAFHIRELARSGMPIGIWG